MPGGSLGELAAGSMEHKIRVCVCVGGGGQIIRCTVGPIT